MKLYRKEEVRIIFWSLFGTLLITGQALWAAPPMLSYQGRIIKSDGRPLEYGSVSFLFQITSPNGLCVLFEEQLDNINMQNSGGVFDTPIGSGSRSFPTSGTASILDVFNNLAPSLPCKGGTTYAPAADDIRKLRVQFHDGSGWRLISPDNAIRSVPFAGFSYQAAKLNGHEAQEFLLKATLPTCTSNTFLYWDGAVLNCEPVSGTAGGTVTNVSSTNSYLSISNGTTNASLTLNVGTSANTVAAGDDSRFSDSRTPTGAAGGALAGTYPNPTLAAGTAAGQVLRYSGTVWQNTKLNYADLINGNGVSPWPGTCGAGEFITWVSVSDGFACLALAASNITTALGYTPADAARTITAGTGLTGGGDLSANRTLAVDVGTGANQIPQLNGSGKLNSSIFEKIGLNISGAPRSEIEFSGGVSGDPLEPNLMRFYDDGTYVFGIGTSPWTVNYRSEYHQFWANSENPLKSFYLSENGATLRGYLNWGFDGDYQGQTAVQSAGGGDTFVFTTAQAAGGLSSQISGGRRVFDVQGAGHTSYLIVHDKDSTTASPIYGVFLSSNGNSYFKNGLGIGTDSPDDYLVVFNGSTTGKYTVGGWTHSSDLRLKHQIKPLDHSLEKILQLQGVEYKFKADPSQAPQIGFIAQQVEPLFPEVVQTDQKGFKSMIYGNLVAPIIEAIKSLYAKVDGSEKEIALLKEENASLRKKLLDQDKKNRDLELNLRLLETQLESRLEKIETSLKSNRNLKPVSNSIPY